MTLPPDAVVGTAAGVPYVLRPPERPRPDAPLVLAWHLMDPPATERAFAAAVPLEGLDAWRVWLGLPLSGARSPGAEEVQRRGVEDAVGLVYEPVQEGALAELPAVLAALRAEHGIGPGPIAVVGGSAGAAVAGGSVVEHVVEARAAVLISPLIQLRPVVAFVGRLFGLDYPWGPASEAVADRMDLVARAGGFAGVPVRTIVGADDDADAFLRPTERFHAAVDALGTPADGHVVAGMGHALAEPPGTEPAPPGEHARRVDELTVDWLRRHLPGAAV